jgi:hypothetical protein
MTMSLGLSMRKYHRWISTVGMVVMLYIALTGLLVIASEIGDPETTKPLAEEYGFDPPGGMSAAKATLPGDPATWAQMARTVMNAARATAPDVQPTSVRVQLRMQNDQPQGVVSFTDASNAPKTLAFNALTGEAMTVPPISMDMGGAPGMGPGGPGPEGMAPGGPDGMAGGPNRTGIFLLDNSQQLHSGAFYGRFFEWLILFTGVGMAVLSVTGIWMYFDMIMRRKAQGRSGWFWS